LFAWPTARAFSVTHHAGEASFSLTFPTDNQIVVGGYHGRLTCFEVTTGDKVWETERERDGENFVYSQALSPDRRRIAVGLNHHSFRLIDAETGKLIYQDTAHQARVSDVRFSSDGKTIASASPDRTIHVRNGETGEPITTVLAGRGVSSVELLDNGETLVASTDPLLKRWSLSDLNGDIVRPGWNQVDSVATLPGTTSFIALARGRREMIMTSPGLPQNGTAETVQLRSPVVTRHVEGNGEVWGTSGAKDGVLNRLNVADNSTSLAMETGHTDLIMTIVFNGSGDLVATSAYDRSIRVHDVETAELKSEFRDLSSDARSLKFDVKTGDLLSHHHGGGVFRWNLNSGEHTVLAEDQGIGLNRFGAFSADGQLLARSRGRVIEVMQTVDGTVQATCNGHAADVLALVFLHDGRTLATAGDDNTVRLWDIETGDLKLTLRGHTAAVLHLAVSADGQTLISGANDGTLRFWRANLHSAKFESLQGIAYSPDGRRIATYGQSTAVPVWDAETRQLLHSFLPDDIPETPRDVGMVAFSPDSTSLAVAGFDEFVRIWDLKTEAVKTLLKGHSVGANAVCYLTDGKTLVSQGNSEFIVWNYTTGKQLRTFSPPESVMLTMSASGPDSVVCGASNGMQFKIQLSDGTVASQIEPATGRSILSQRVGDNRLVYATSNGQIILANLDTGEEIAAFDGPSPDLYAC
jgi:WD40 repeat protein